MSSRWLGGPHQKRKGRCEEDILYEVAVDADSDDNMFVEEEDAVRKYRDWTTVFQCK